MSGTPLKKIIKSKIKSNKELTEAEKMREKLKYEIAEELGLGDKVDKEGWGNVIKLSLDKLENKKINIQKIRF
ncbi:hypothetical protein FDB47_07330 [Clostridium botulinum]|nr:hypothetical protein [Clostridium botulinum]